MIKYFFWNHPFPNIFYPLFHKITEKGVTKWTFHFLNIFKKPKERIAQSILKVKLTPGANLINITRLMIRSNHSTDLGISQRGYQNKASKSVQIQDSSTFNTPLKSKPYYFPSKFQKTEEINRTSKKPL